MWRRWADLWRLQLQNQNDPTVRFSSTEHLQFYLTWCRCHRATRPHGQLQTSGSLSDDLNTNLSPSSLMSTPQTCRRHKWTFPFHFLHRWRPVTVWQLHKLHSGTTLRSPKQKSSFLLISESCFVSCSSQGPLVSCCPLMVTSCNIT